jgi:hypothetical protein
MESLWLPWLLVCPYYGGMALLRSIPAGITWLGTIPLLSMQPFGVWLALPAIALLLRRIVQGGGLEAGLHVGAVSAPGRLRWLPALACTAIPFVLPHLIAPAVTPLLPSPALIPKAVTGSAYLVRAPGQAADVAVLWYGGRGGGRHHSLESCLTLRGISADRLGGVLKRDDVWVTEFFLHGGEIHASYASYLLSTLAPWSPAGVHLVLQSPVESMDAGYFAHESRRTVKMIEKIHSRGNRARPAST